MKINKLCIYLLLILAGFFIPKVKAAQLNGGQFGWSWNGSTSAGWYQDPAGQNLPKSFSLSGNSSSSNYVLNIYSGNYDFNEYTYFYLDTCSNFGQYNFYVDISNSSYGNSYFQTGSYRPIYDYGSCNMGNTNLTHHLVIEIPVGRYYYSDSFYTADSYLKFRTTTSYSSNVQINYAFVSNEKLSDSAKMETTLNSINTAMSTMNTNISNQAQNIINNNNTNTQNIINNQNTNAAQAHTDAQNTQNTIKDDSVDSPNSSINTIKGSLASNGVITSLVVLPVTLYQAILNSVNGTCSTFSLGSLFGTNLTIPCINVANYLGTTLWGSIDVIISGIFIYMISRKMVKVFHQLSSLKEGDVLDG